MHPVKTERANFTFLGDGETVGDVWVERRLEDGTTRLTYEPSAEDLQVLAAGGRVELALWIGDSAMPPVSLVVLDEASTHPVGEHYAHPMGPDR